MARKSRKKINTESKIITAPAPKRIPAAIYVRISVDQDDDTLDNQVELLQQYARENHELEVIDVYADNGYSGTSFERPEFTRMINDVKTGKIQCILVKDLSRFGRNFLETGYYIETILPKLNAKLISVNDDFDSSREQDRNDLSIPIKNMVNELYAKDASKKACAYVANSQRRGDFPIEHAVYGYTVDREKNVYQINPQTAPIVQLIFLWKLKGVTTVDIARRLNMLGVLTPNEYKYRYEFKKPYTGKKEWNIQRVNDIAIRQVYVGDRVLGKRKIEAYKNQKKARKTKEEEWIIHKNTHDPIILREEFETIYQASKERQSKWLAAHEERKRLNQTRESVFPSKVICGKCGQTMSSESLTFLNGKIKTCGEYYACKTQTALGGCRTMVNEDFLKVIVKRQLSMMLKNFSDQKKVLDKLLKKRNEQNPVYRYENRIKSLENRMGFLLDKIGRLYEDYANGMIEIEDFQTLKDKYQEERQSLEIQRNETEETLNKMCLRLKELEDLAGKISDVLDGFAINRAVVNQFIDRIVFHSKDKLEIHYKYQDLFRDMQVLTGEEACES